MAPLLVYPTHYTGEMGYISDTGSSDIVPDIIKSMPENGRAGKGCKEGKANEELQVEFTIPAEPEAPIIEEINPAEFRTEL